MDGPLADVLRYRILHGGADLTGDNLLVSQKWAADNHWDVGSTVSMLTPDQSTVRDHDQRHLRRQSTAGQLAGVRRSVPPVDAEPAAHRRGGAGQGRAREPTRRRCAPGWSRPPTRSWWCTCRTARSSRARQASQINTLLAVLYGLLALAIVIAVLGIINTLALSVVERRREIGMLRAVGMLRPQLRRTIYLESMLIAVFGALVGLAMGLVFGSLFVRTLRDQGLDQVSVPVGQAVLMLVLAGGGRGAGRPVACGPGRPDATAGGDRRPLTAPAIIDRTGLLPLGGGSPVRRFPGEDRPKNQQKKSPTIGTEWPTGVTVDG